jgi:transcriptional regulator with XRE-family HTH domain
MSDATSPAEQIRGLRRQQQWTQEELAERAGLSVTTIKKAECRDPGKTVTTATLHAIARALDVTTTELYADRPPAPMLEAEPDHQALARLRAAIAPPATLDGTPLPLPSDGPVDLEAIRARVQRAEAVYRADRYDDVAEALPAMLADAHRAVAEEDSDEAYRTRSLVLQMAGRYLTQVRQIDLALTPLGAAVRDAAHAGDRVSACNAVDGQGWALTRQGRLAEAERLSTVTADEMEPRSIRHAAPDELAAWGHILFRASAAAIRDNAADRARELLRAAESAAAALGRETDCWATFGPLTTAQKSIEFSLLEGKPDHVLRDAERLPRVQDVGDVTPINWERHRLDVASAKLATRDPEGATGVLTGVLHRAPHWLQRQRSAYETVQGILATRPRRPTEEMAALATHLGVAA